MELVDDLRWRGLLQDVSDEQLFTKLRQGDAFYAGFDPTAPSLHHGNLQLLVTMMRLGRAGFRPIALFGGATGAIGDPGGRSAERPLLSREEIDRNVALHSARVTEIFARVGVEASYVNNFDWFRSVSVLDFLRDTGKYFTVNYMIAKEVVKSRLDGDGMSFTEFSYMLLQAADYLHLYQNHNCRLQIGGSDQWGNITAGLELIRKKISGEAYAFSSPLLLDAQGRKLGKSTGGAVWLDRAMLSPYKFHQFFLNVGDAEVITVLKRLTLLTRPEIEALELSLTNAPEKRECQRALADAMCDMVHGKEATLEAKRSAEVLFGGSIDGLADKELREIFADVPSSRMDRKIVAALTPIDLFTQCGLGKSKSESRRLIESGGGYLNNVRVTDGNGLIGEATFGDRTVLVARAGKKNYHLVLLD
jgi:tyrosyl-tRNA synthetase